jgi:hypothetical protein
MDEVIRPDSPRNRGDYDAPHLSGVTPAEDARTIMINRIAWGAVLAGVAVALVTQLILNMIGIGVGASTLDPLASAPDNPSPSALGMSAAIWWTVSGILASLAGGYAAGRLAGKPKESTAGWHGLTAWAATTLLVFYLLTSAVGGLVGGAYRTVANAAGNMASAAGGAAQTAVQAAAPSVATGAVDPINSIEQSVRDASGGNDPAALRDAAVSSVRAVMTGNPQQVQDARERAAQALSKAQGIPVEQARTQVQQYEQQYRQAVEQAKAKAAQAADVAAKAVTRGALFGSLALILGALAAWFGGRMGAVEPTVTGSVTTAYVQPRSTVSETATTRSMGESATRRS